MGALTAGLAMVLLAVASPTPAPTPKVEVGKPVPWIAALDLEGNAHSLGSMLARKGVRGAVVPFWAIWCRACKDELRQLSAGRDRLKSVGVEVLLVDVADPPDEVAKMVAELGLGGFTLIRDATGGVVDSVGLSRDEKGQVSLPFTLVVSARGEVKLVLREGGDGLVDRVLAVLEKEPVRGGK